MRGKIEERQRKSMNILVIDYLSPEGHKNFDQIHIKALLELGHNLHLVGKRNQFVAFENQDEIKITSFPQWVFKTLPFKPLSERAMGVIRLKWLFGHLEEKKYDVIILLSYDVLSLFLFKFKKKLFLINHNNTSQIYESRIKLFLTKHLPTNYIHIALNETMKEGLETILPQKKVVYVPHGYAEKSAKEEKPFFIKEGERFIFCPVNNNYDKELLSKVLNSNAVRDYLIKENLVLYVKKNIEYSGGSEPILRITSYLTTEEYNYMLNNALAVILPYGQLFKYRCSGIFFECMAKETPIVATKIPDMIAYSDNAKIIFFDDEKSFVEALSNLKEIVQKVVNKELYQPKNYWKSIINETDSYGNMGMC